MNRRAMINGLVLVANCALGAWVVASLYSRQVEREAEVEAVRVAAANDRETTAELERQVGVQEAVLDGLRVDDPYVVEFMTRDKLGWQGRGEIRPPPLINP